MAYLKFNSHPQIEVFYVPEPHNVAEEMVAEMRAGTAPDVFTGCCDFFPIWAQQGYLLSLAPYAADLDHSVTDDWDPAQVRAFYAPNGHQYGLPMYHGALALNYNKDLFDTYGVDHPAAGWNHDAYLSAINTRYVGQMMYRTTPAGKTDHSWSRLNGH